MIITLTGAQATRGGDAVCLTVSLEGRGGEEERQITLLPEDAQSYLSRLPLRITPETLEAIEAAGRRCAAVTAALRLLEYGDNTSHKLKTKLKARGVSKEDAEYAARYMTERGYIDDRALLREEILRAANEKLHGRRRIISDMFARGYAQQDIRETLELCECEIDYAENKKALLMRRYGTAELPRDFAAAQKVRAFLARAGY